MANPGPQRDSRIVSVRLEPEKTHAVLNAMDDAAGQSSHNRAVRAPRRIFNLNAAITQLGGSKAQFVVVTRNISTRGLAFLHGYFVHPGSRFNAVLPSLDGQTIAKVSGVVVRCRHVTGMIHEVAVRFDSSIDLPMFADLSPEEEQRCWNDIELAGPGKGAAMSGTFLVVDGDAAQRSITAGWLGRMGFKVTEMAGPDEAIKAVKDSKFDIILLDLTFPDENGLLACKKIRNTGFAGQIIGATAGTDRATHEKAMHVGCDATLAKPITGRSLFETINRLVDVKNEPKAQLEGLRSVLEFDPSMKPLIAQFVRKVPAAANALGAALEPFDADRVKTLCGTLKSEGGPHGFWQVTRFADDVLASLGRDPAETARRVNRLIVLLRRVTTSEAAAA